MTLRQVGGAPGGPGGQHLDAVGLPAQAEGRAGAGAGERGWAGVQIQGQLLGPGEGRCPPQRKGQQGGPEGGEQGTDGLPGDSGLP